MQNRYVAALAMSFPSRGSWLGEAEPDEVVFQAFTDGWGVLKTTSSGASRHLPREGKAFWSGCDPPPSPQGEGLGKTRNVAVLARGFPSRGSWLGEAETDEVETYQVCAPGR